MADELAPGAAGQGTEETPVDNGQGLDYERSYNELRPQFTRATQDLAEHRERLSEYEELFNALQGSDPELQAQAFDALGLQLDTGSHESGRDPNEFVDPLEEELAALRSQVSKLTSARELEAEKAEQAELDQLRDEFIGEAIGYIETNEFQEGFKFTKAEEQALGNLAIAMEDDEGIPDVQGAYNLLFGDEGVVETNRSRWIETKTGASQAPAGRSTPVEKKLTTPADRIRYIDERVRAEGDQL